MKKPFRDELNATQSQQKPCRSCAEAAIARLAAAGISSRRVLAHPAGVSARRVQPHKTMAAD